MRFFTSTRLITLLLALLCALAVPATAFADGDDVIRDCAEDGDLDRDYSDEELEEANRDMPSDIDEYSNCRETIRQAQAGGRGSKDGTSESEESGGGTGGAGSGSGGDGGGYRDAQSGSDVSAGGGTASDNEELRLREEAARNGTAPAGGESASALGGGDGSGDDDSGLPVAAIVALVLLALAAVGSGLYALRDRLPAGLTSRLPGFGPGQGR